MSGCKENLTESFSFSKEEKLISETLYLTGYNFESENPLLVKNEINREIFSLIYDGLFSLDKNYVPVPQIAKSITMSDDCVNYTIEIREDIKFHDGTTLTANDVVSTINYLKGNNTYYDYNVRQINSVKANGKNKVLITLNKEAQNLSSLLTFPVVSAKDIIKDFNFNGNGRFKVENYIKRKTMTLTANENYYNKTDMELKKISIQLMPDKETANYSNASGLSDIYVYDIFENADTSAPKTGATPKEYVSLNYNFLLINNAMPVFSDVNIRRAINMAIDKEYIVEDILFSHGVKVSNPIPEESIFYNKEYDVEYSTEKAKKLIYDSGYTPNINTGVMEKETENGVLSLSFNIMVNNDNNFRIQVANAIRDNLKSVGIEANVNIVSYEEYVSNYINKTYEAFVGAVPMAPDFDMTMFMGEYNISNYYNEQSIRTLYAIGTTDDIKRKKEYYNALLKIFRDDVPHISLYYTKANLHSSSKIKKGIEPTGVNIFNNIENWSFNE